MDDLIQSMRGAACDTTDDDAAYLLRHAADALEAAREDAERLAEALRMMEALLDEVRSSFTRDDDLPSGLLPRIDAALRDHD